MIYCKNIFVHNIIKTLHNLSIHINAITTITTYNTITLRLKFLFLKQKSKNKFPKVERE
jgi:hypothetical protein